MQKLRKRIAKAMYKQKTNLYKNKNKLLHETMF